MEIGYFGANIGTFDNADAIERLAKAVEGLGYESLWTAEHVILVDPQAGGSPVAPTAPFVDTIATLAFLGAVTKRIKLGSGILLIPQRNPVVLANELAEAAIGRSGKDVVTALGYAWRETVQAHPGIYAATDRFPCAGDDELEAAVERIVAILSQALDSYDLSPRTGSTPPVRSGARSTDSRTSNPVTVTHTPTTETTRSII